MAVPDDRDRARAIALADSNLIHEILRFLHPRDIGRAVQVSKLWCTCASADALWGSILGRRFKSAESIGRVQADPVVGAPLKQLFPHTRMRWPNSIASQFFSELKVESGDLQQHAASDMAGSASPNTGAVTTDTTKKMPVLRVRYTGRSGGDRAVVADHPFPPLYRGRGTAPSAGLTAPFVWAPAVRLGPAAGLTSTGKTTASNTGPSSGLASSSASIPSYSFSAAGAGFTPSMSGATGPATGSGPTPGQPSAGAPSFSGRPGKIVRVAGPYLVAYYEITLEKVDTKAGAAKSSSETTGSTAAGGGGGFARDRLGSWPPCVAVGLANRRFPLSGAMPGWCKYSYGYHGDDGLKFHGDGRGKRYGPRFAEGDTVGCGLVYAGATNHAPSLTAPASANGDAEAAEPLSHSRDDAVIDDGGEPAEGHVEGQTPTAAARGPRTASEWQQLSIEECAAAWPHDQPGGVLFFTKNGQMLGPAFTAVDVTKRWYPAAGLDTPHPVVFNFGATPFAFDIRRFNACLWARAATPHVALPRVVAAAIFRNQSAAGAPISLGSTGITIAPRPPLARIAGDTARGSPGVGVAPGHGHHAGSTPPPSADRANGAGASGTSSRSSTPLPSASGTPVGYNGAGAGAGAGPLPWTMGVTSSPARPAFLDCLRLSDQQLEARARQQASAALKSALLDRLRLLHKRPLSPVRTRGDVAAAGDAAAAASSSAWTADSGPGSRVHGDMEADIDGIDGMSSVQEGGSMRGGIGSPDLSATGQPSEADHLSQADGASETGPHRSRAAARAAAARDDSYHADFMSQDSDGGTSGVGSPRVGPVGLGARQRQAGAWGQRGAGAGMAVGRRHIMPAVPPPPWQVGLGAAAQAASADGALAVAGAGMPTDAHRLPIRRRAAGRTSSSDADASAGRAAAGGADRQTASPIGAPDHKRSRTNGPATGRSTAEGGAGPGRAGGASSSIPSAARPLDASDSESPSEGEGRFQLGRRRREAPAVRGVGAGRLGPGVLLRNILDRLPGVRDRIQELVANGFPDVHDGEHDEDDGARAGADGHDGAAGRPRPGRPGRVLMDRAFNMALGDLRDLLAVDAGGNGNNNDEHMGLDEDDSDWMDDDDDDSDDDEEEDSADSDFFSDEPEEDEDEDDGRGRNGRGGRGVRRRRSYDSSYDSELSRDDDDDDDGEDEDRTPHRGQAAGWHDDEDAGGVAAGRHRMVTRGRAAAGAGAAEPAALGLAFRGPRVAGARGPSVVESTSDVSRDSDHDGNADHDDDMTGFHTARGAGNSHETGEGYTGVVRRMRAAAAEARSDVLRMQEAARDRLGLGRAAQGQSGPLYGDDQDGDDEDDMGVSLGPSVRGGADGHGWGSAGRHTGQATAPGQATGPNGGQAEATRSTTAAPSRAVRRSAREEAALSSLAAHVAMEPPGWPAVVWDGSIDVPVGQATGQSSASGQVATESSNATGARTRDRAVFPPVLASVGAGGGRDGAGSSAGPEQAHPTKDM